MTPYGYLPPEQRKKILLLSDDLRMPSGVGVMSREIVVGTVQHFHWIQVAAAVVHPEAGKMLDASTSLSEDTGIDGVTLRLYPYNGYGDVQLIRYLIKTEKPDAIMLFTDPRYFIWLFQMEHEIRQHIPILYYNIWDDLPYPKYNKPYYQSVDGIFAISRQTYNINKQVLGADRGNIAIKYIPHGINPTQFFPMDDTREDHQVAKVEMRKKLFGEDEVEFVVLYNNRNIRRKMTGDVILAYREFVLGLPEECQKKCRLVLHTQPVDDNGTDLYSLVEDVASDVPIVFSVDRIDTDKLNVLYNISDVVINLASNEGFGLGTCEALMAGRMILVNVTGGLQDQCGFVDDEGNRLHEDVHYCYAWGSNHDGRYKLHGKWAMPIFPAQRALIGSPPTPYIFDDRCRWEDAAVGLRQIYDLTPDERKERGMRGHQYVMEEGFNSLEMNKRFIDNIDEVIVNWKPRKRFELIKG